MRLSLSFSSPVLFFLVILFLAINVDADIVHETCQKASQVVKKIQYDFCVAALGQDPKSHSSDLLGLGIISVDLLIENATKVTSRIEELLNDNKTSPLVKICLHDCEKHYYDAKVHAKDAIDAFKSKEYKAANYNVATAMNDAMICNDGFEEISAKSPLIAESNRFLQ